MLGPHANFILAAYAAAAVIGLALVAWIVVDHRRQRALLATLERHSPRAATPPAPSSP